MEPHLYLGGGEEKEGGGGKEGEAWERFTKKTVEYARHSDMSCHSLSNYVCGEESSDPFSTPGSTSIKW